nr:hypothetical protein HmN_000579900 [Hymenolepis microstoma]
MRLCNSLANSGGSYELGESSTEVSEYSQPDSIHSAAEQFLTTLRFPFQSHDSFGDPHPSPSIAISSTLSFRPLLLPQNVSGNRSRHICVRCRSLFLPLRCRSLLLPQDFNTRTHGDSSTGKPRLRPASTPPEDFRPFQWTVALKHPCYQPPTVSYGSTSYRLKRAHLEPSSKPAFFVGTQLSRSIVQPSKDIVQLSSQPLQPLIEPGCYFS